MDWKEQLDEFLVEAQTHKVRKRSGYKKGPLSNGYYISRYSEVRQKKQLVVYIDTTGRFGDLETLNRLLGQITAIADECDNYHPYISINLFSDEVYSELDRQSTYDFESIDTDSIQTEGEANIKAVYDHIDDAYRFGSDNERLNFSSLMIISDHSLALQDEESLASYNEEFERFSDRIMYFLPDADEESCESGFIEEASFCYPTMSDLLSDLEESRG